MFFLYRNALTGLLILVILVSGCVETGRIIDRRDFDPFYDETGYDEVPDVTKEGKAEGGDEVTVNYTPEAEEDVCDKECGICEEIDYSDCECLPVPGCCGNGICEYGETCEDDCPEKSILFSEIVYDSRSPENRKEWFEIYNPTGKSLDLTGFMVSDSDFGWEFPEGFVLRPDEFITIARDSEGFFEEYGCEPVISGFSRTLNNDGDSLVLSDDDGRILDKVCWKGVNGWDIEASEGNSIKRKDWNDSDLPEDWEGGKTATPWGCPVGCEPGEKVCEDGFVARCENLFIDDDCQHCDPDCTGHEIVQCEEQWICSEWGECEGGEQRRTCSDMNKCGTGRGKPDEILECLYCDITCGNCQVLDTEACCCHDIAPCDGNGICEEGEYGESGDCTDCGDDDPCTSDHYNYSTGTCYYEEISPCCGNGICEENETCPGDCGINETCESVNIIINEIMYNPSTSQCNDNDCEWIELYNAGDCEVNFSGWTLNGKTLGNGILHPDEYMVIARELVDGDDSDYESFEYFWGDGNGKWGNSEAESYNALDCSMVLKNLNDTVILKNLEGTMMDSLIYSNYWGADGNNRTLEKSENGTWTESPIDGGTPGSENYG